MTTQRHRRLALGPLIRTKSARSALRARGGRVLHRDPTPDVQRVRTYRRSRPRDGIRKVVKVRHHYRRLGWNQYPRSWLG